MIHIFLSDEMIQTNLRVMNSSHTYGPHLLFRIEIMVSQETTLYLRAQ